MQPIVTTAYGQVRGEMRDGVARFLGIPYAASPTGALRFAAPVPPEPWEGVRDADAFSATPPKPDYIPPIAAVLYETAVPGDDWLSVNVWSPDVTATGLPVMVWIHGGAFVNGNSSLPAYDGHAFARDGVVFVSLNYRLGVDGFALLPDAPANRGLLDQVAALEWVRDTIAAFGGDPGNVTVAGESAGAMSVTTLMAMPSARGLFAKAVTQSGAVQAAADPADAAMVTRELGAVLGIEATAANLATLDIDTLLAAQQQISGALAAGPDPGRFGASVVAASMAFVPVVDGETVPVHPMAAIAAGAGADVPVLTGTTTEEYRLFLVPTQIAPYVTEEALAGLCAAMGIPAAVTEVYRANRPGASPGDLMAALLTDAYFRLPALAVAAARRGAPTYVYELAWRSGAGDLGACHALDIPFVFDTLAATGAEGLTGPNPPQRLADRMHGAWVAFARTGDPGWPALDGSYPVMVFDGDAATVVSDPRGDERAAWRR
jgi:para-nitrobenzyl esterase